MWDVKTFGERQYTDFQSRIFQNKKYIQSSIKQNKLPIFIFIQQRRSQQLWKKLGGLKNDVSLCSHLYVADNLQERDLAILSSYEKQLHLPSLCDQEILKSSKKSDSIKYMKPSVLQDKL